MKQNNKALAALSFLFVLGNAVIITPFANSNKFAFLGFMIAMLISFAVYFICLLIPINKLTVIPIILFCFFIVADAFITLIRFISYDLRIKNSLIILPVLVILLFIGLKRTSVLLKLSLLLLPFCVGIILLFFLSTAKDFNLRNIFIYEIPPTASLLSQIYPFIKVSVLPMGVLALFVKGENARVSVGFCGLGLGFCALAICILNSVLLFGIEFAGGLKYPYSLAGSTVTFGNLFTRMDGLLYFLYMASVLIKCGVGIMVIKKSRKLILP